MKAVEFHRQICKEVFEKNIISEGMELNWVRALKVAALIFMMSNKAGDLSSFLKLLCVQKADEKNE